jgi:hypothetical protein
MGVNDCPHQQPNPVQVLSIEYRGVRSCPHEVLIGEKGRSKKEERGIVFLELSLYQTLCCSPPSFALPNIGPVKLGVAARLRRET